VPMTRRTMEGKPIGAMRILLHSFGVRTELKTPGPGVREHQTLSYPRLISFTTARCGTSKLQGCLTKPPAEIQQPWARELRTLSWPRLIPLTASR
jgi:hypothetical protein